MIRIVSGTYGYREKGRVVPKNSKSEPFSLDEKEEERLVKSGVAVYVNGEDNTGGKDDTENKANTNKGNKGKKGKSEGTRDSDTDTQTDIPAPSFDASGTVVN